MTEERTEETLREDLQKLMRHASSGDEAALDELASVLQRGGYGASTRWEYQITTQDHPPSKKVTEHLNAMGEDGWMMTHMKGWSGSPPRMYYYWRRPIR